MTAASEPLFITATPADAALIRDIVNAACKRWVKVIGRDLTPMGVDYASAAVQNRIDLLSIGDLITGLVETSLRDDHLWIENIAVSPVEQGKGYGKCLLAHAEKLARAAGKAEIRLRTDAALEANIALYRRMGYNITATEPFLNGTAVFMSKRLTSP